MQRAQRERAEGIRQAMTAERKAKPSPEGMMYQNGFIDGEEAGAANMRRRVLREIRKLKNEMAAADNNLGAHYFQALWHAIDIVAAIGKPKAKQRGRG